MHLGLKPALIMTRSRDANVCQSQKQCLGFCVSYEDDKMTS